MAKTGHDRDAVWIVDRFDIQAAFYVVMAFLVGRIDDDELYLSDETQDLIAEAFNICNHQKRERLPASRQASSLAAYHRKIDKLQDWAENEYRKRTLSRRKPEAPLPPNHTCCTGDRQDHSPTRTSER